jgi:hypothetical protein
MSLSLNIVCYPPSKIMWFAFSGYVFIAVYCGGLEGVPLLCNLYSRDLSVRYYCQCNMFDYVYLCVFFFV